TSSMMWLSLCSWHHRRSHIGQERSSVSGMLVVMATPTLGPTARILRLLDLLQSRPTWSGTELADRLGVTTRSVRRDVERLRELGYPVRAEHGAAGGYQLGTGRRLPPLLLDDQ